MERTINIDILKGKIVYYLHNTRLGDNYVTLFPVDDINYEDKYIISYSVKYTLDFNDYGTKWFLSKEDAEKYTGTKLKLVSVPMMR